MASQKYRGSCIGTALAKWLAKNTVASQKMALEEKMEDGALEMLLSLPHRDIRIWHCPSEISSLLLQDEMGLQSTWAEACYHVVSCSCGVAPLLTD